MFTNNLNLHVQPYFGSSPFLFFFLVARRSKLILHWQSILELAIRDDALRKNQWLENLCIKFSTSMNVVDVATWKFVVGVVVVYNCWFRNVAPIVHNFNSTKRLIEFQVQLKLLDFSITICNIIQNVISFFLIFFSTKRLSAKTLLVLHHNCWE